MEEQHKPPAWIPAVALLVVPFGLLLMAFGTRSNRESAVGILFVTVAALVGAITWWMAPPTQSGRWQVTMLTLGAALTGIVAVSLVSKLTAPGGESSASRPENSRPVQLRGANVDGADLRGTVLDRADLRNLSAKGARFGGASLRAADLRNAVLTNADFTNACLRGVDLRGADVRSIVLTGADLSGSRTDGIDPALLPTTGAQAASGACS